MKLSLSDLFLYLDDAYKNPQADSYIKSIYGRTWGIAQRFKLLQANGLVKSRLKDLIDFDILSQHKFGHPSWATRHDSLTALAPEARVLHRLIWSTMESGHSWRGVEASLAMDALLYPLGAVEKCPWAAEWGSPEQAIAFIEETQLMFPSLEYIDIKIVHDSVKLLRWSQSRLAATELDEAALSKALITWDSLHTIHIPSNNTPDKWSMTMRKFVDERESLPCDVGQAFLGNHDGVLPKWLGKSEDPLLRSFGRDMKKRWDNEIGWARPTRMGQFLAFLFDGAVLVNDIQSHPQRPNFFAQPELQQDWYERLGPPHKPSRSKTSAREKLAKLTPWMVESETSKKLFLGKFPVYYGLIYLSVRNTYIDSDPFQNQQNRWIGAASPGSVVLSSELHTGDVQLALWLVDSAPTMPPEDWTEVAEVSFVVEESAKWELQDWNGDICKRLRLSAGCYRARFARARLRLTNGETSEREYCQLVMWPTAEIEPELRLRG